MHSNNYGVESNHSLTVPFHKLNLPLIWKVAGTSFDDLHKVCQTILDHEVQRVYEGVLPILCLKWAAPRSLAWTLKRHLSFLLQKDSRVLQSLCSCWRKDKLLWLLPFMGYHFFSFKERTVLSKKHFFGPLWILHKAPYGGLKQS